MTRNAIILARLLQTLLILAAAALGPAPVQAAAPAAAVTIDNFSFTPATLTIPPGTEVTWTNHDDIPHTVVIPGAAQPFKSPVLDTDDHVTHTFGRRGRYKYFCSLHPHMQGTVIVQ